MTLIRMDAPSRVADWAIKIASSLIVISWLILNYADLQKLFASYRDISSFNLMIFGLVAIVLLVQTIRQRRKIELSSIPKLHPLPLALMLGSEIVAIIGRWLVDIPQIGLMLLAIATYGLIGLFIAPKVWRTGLPAAVFVACILPFSTQFDTGLGFPVRVVSARIVEQILAYWQIAATSSHDIIVLENSIAQIDLPCSGLRSLWTGTLFLLAATWLENRQIKLRWLLVCIANILLLIGANTGRILLLVVISNVGDRPDLAAIVHLPLGLIGFISASLVTWLLLQTVPRHKNIIPQAKEIKTVPLGKSLAPLTKQFIVIASILLLALVPHPPKISTGAIASIALPAEMQFEPLPLTATEKSFFAKYEGSFAQKSRFEWQNIAGSILFVSSSSVQAYHAPELCLLGNGLKVDNMQKKQLSPQVLGRWLSINNGTMSATYWFQSSKNTTDDFLTRFWQGIIHKDRVWVMVSVLFDRQQQPDTPEIRTFTTNIYDAIALSLTGV